VESWIESGLSVCKTLIKASIYKRCHAVSSWYV
jgi:hypothetical protein